MNIPDEAVEALARILANESLFDADLNGYGWDSETDSSDHFMPSARKKARGYLNAAGPILWAQAANHLADGMEWAGDAELGFVQGFAEAATEYAGGN